MKKILSFQLVIVTAFISFTASQSYAKLDILREIDNLVDASRPNVLIMLDHNRAMAGDYTDTGSGGSTHDDTNVNSRMFQLKDVMRGLNDGISGGTILPADSVLTATQGVVNYGLMGFQQHYYWPYFTANCLINPNLCKSNDPQMIMNPANNNYTFPGKAFIYNSFIHNGTDFANPVDHPINGTAYFHYNYAAGSLTKSDPIMFNDGSIGSNEGIMRGGKVYVPINPNDPTSNIDSIRDWFKLQNLGGLVVSGNSASVDKMWSGSSLPATDATAYFQNVVIPADSQNYSACFNKNYIILLSAGTNNSANWNTVANEAKTLRDGLTVGGATHPIKTFVIGFVDTTTVTGNLRANLNDVARNGWTDANGTDGIYGLNPSANTHLNTVSDETDDAPSCAGTDALGNGGCNDYAFFVKSKEDLIDALLAIIKTISRGDFVTGSPSATSSSGSFVLNNVGMLASAEYPEWRGHLRSVDLVNDYFRWDAGVTLFLDSLDTKLPNAYSTAIPELGDSHSSWRDTNGDSILDQPPLMLKVGSDVYRYTDRVLYCKTTNYAANNCISSALASNEYVGTTTNFKIAGTDTNYTYKGAFYMPPYTNRTIYTSDLSGSVLSFSTTNWSTINTLAGWGVGQNEAKAIINFALGAIDADKNGSVDTGVDLNEDGDTGDTVNTMLEATMEVTREWWLGDITNVVTVGVGKPISPKDGLSGRDTFRNSYTNRDTVIYTGSNDQMLHAYDFITGVEKFAYIPPDLLSNLKTLYDNAMASSAPESFMGQPPNPTDHVYGIASSPKVTDVQIDDNSNGTYESNEWHTVLVSGEGPGGNHYFALDVTDPSLTFGTSFYTLLWHTAMTSPNLAGDYASTLGETWSTPAFARIDDGGTNKWVVFAGSGYDDTSYGDGKGEIFHVINIADGTLLTDPTITGNFFMGGSSPTVQYGLLPDSVSMIKKSGSKVEDGYQVDLKGRAYHIDTSNTIISSWDKTELISSGPANNASYVRPTIAKPFHYSPAIWDFDNTSATSKHLMILGSGAYDDPEMERKEDDDDGDGIAASNEVGDSFRNPNGLTADLTSTLYFTIVNPAATPAVMIDAFSVEMSAVSGAEVDGNGNLTGSTVSAGALSGAVLLASPVLFNNQVSPDVFELQALFLVFIPPAAGDLGCSFGNSYLLVFGLGNTDTIVNSSGTGFASTSDISNTKSGTAKFVVSIGAGKASGIGVAGGGSHVVVGQSGYGGGSTSGYSIAGSSTWDPIGTTTKLYWKTE